MTAVQVLNAIDEIISELELQENYSDHYINFGLRNKAYASDEHVGNIRVKKLFLAKRNEYLELGSSWGAKRDFVTRFLEEEKFQFYEYSNDNGPEVSLIEDEIDKQNYFKNKFRRWS